MARRMRFLPALAFAVLVSTIPVAPAAAANRSPAATANPSTQLDWPRSLPQRHARGVTLPASNPRRSVAPQAFPACNSTFNTISTPSPGSSDNALANNGLLTLSPTNIWAVGFTTDTVPNPPVLQTLIEHFDGTGWVQVVSPNIMLNGTQPTDNVLEGISGVSATDIWAVGAFITAGNAWQPLLEHYNGTTWTANTFPSLGSGDNILFGVTAMSATNVMAVGYQRFNNSTAPAQTLAINYDGSQWTAGTTPNVGTGSNAFLAVAAGSASDIWAVGRSTSASGYRQTLIEHFTGSSWAVVASPNGTSSNNYLYGVSVLGATSAWTVGFYFDPSVGRTRSLIERWNGTSWTLVPSPSVGLPANPFDELFSVKAISANDVWAVGDANSGVLDPSGVPTTGITIAEHWNGSTWTAITSGNSSTGFNELNAVAAASPTNVWAVGDYFNSSHVDQTLAAQFCLAAPAVTDVKPTIGNTRGGDEVTVIGDGLAFATGVSFGAVPATSIRIDSEHQLTATTPAEPDSVVDVRVTNDAGTSAPVPIDKYRFGPFASSTRQYQLADSDGVTWRDMDPSRLVVSLTPITDSYAILSGNVDLWTADSGFNQDVGISLFGGIGTGQGVYPTVAGQPEAWKESGGFAGTFSPNAAFVQTVVFLKQGTTYTATLQWKTNRVIHVSPRIFAGAGPWPLPNPNQDTTLAGFSPTRLTAQLIPAASANLKSASITNQPVLSGSNGSTWVDMDPALSFPYTPSADGNALISTNADLWTNTARYNQDIGITVSGGTSPAYPSVAGQPEVWKESGGFAGTFSPNAAFAQGVVPLKQGVTYTIKVQWKANKASPASAAIVAGAGPIGGRFSPTSLMLLFAPPAPGPAGSYQIATTAQHQLSGPVSDGASFQEIDSSVTFGTGSNSDCIAILSGNADLWTANAGYNQDIAVELSGTVIGWKESGGYAGTFSPNAAFVQTPFAVTATRTYTLTLTWKANKPAQNATIVAGAGPIGGRFSPTSLTLQTIGCT